MLLKPLKSLKDKINEEFEKKADKIIKASREAKKKVVNKNKNKKNEQKKVKIREEK